MNHPGWVPGHRWADGAAGPVIRPYALTGGRTSPAGEFFDLIAMVIARQLADPVLELEPEHLRVLALCNPPRSVADLAADTRIPLGVLRVILSDLREERLVTIRPPTPLKRILDDDALWRIEDALRRL